MAKVLFKRKTTNEIKNLEVEDGALIYNTDNGKTYMDFGEDRIQTGGNADTMIAIGGEEAPTDTDIKIWIKDKDNQNYNNFYYRNENNKFEQMFLQPTGDTLPVGSISAYGGENIPTNWLKCNGEAISRTDYPDLFKAIGTTYGSGDGSTTFNLPNISERVIVGNAGDGEFSLGTTGGEKEHTLTIDEMPAHKHELTIEGGGSLGASGVKWLTGTNMRKYAGDMIENAGGNQAHNNMQPYIVLNYIIKAKQSVGIVGNVTSNINDTNDNAVPNAKTVKDYVKEVYSKDEVKTNKIWIDGKPIYRRTFSGTLTVSNLRTTHTIGSNISSSWVDNGNSFLNTPDSVRAINASESADTTTNVRTEITNNKTILNVISGGSSYYMGTYYVTVEYTKTTD